MSGPAGPKDRRGVWILPVKGGALQKLADDAWGAVPSPDNSRIAFVRSSAPELWVMNSTGEQPRNLFTAPEGYGLTEDLSWSADGRHIMFAKQSRSWTDFKICNVDIESGQSVEVLSDPLARGFTWARDGRLIFIRLESAGNRQQSNLWEIPVDPHTGRASGKARRLTKWPDFDIRFLSLSADGKRLSFMRERLLSNVYIAGLNQRGEQLVSRRLFTSDEWMSWPTAWTPGGEAVLFHSNRDGVVNIFRQSIGATDAEAIVRTRQENRDARMSPDHRWILYLSWSTTGTDNSGRLMRIAATGGEPETLFTVHGSPGPPADEPRASRPAPYAGEGNIRFRCPTGAIAPCILSEKIGNEVLFSAFDPAAGRKGDVARIPVAPFQLYFWDLSPDGSRIAFGASEETRAIIRILALSGQSGSQIAVKGGANLTSVAWAADGKSLFASAWASKDPPLLRVSLDGRVQLLSTGGYIENVVPSPDGRRIAFGDANFSGGNVWLVDNFR